ncbi:MAG TPA: DNA double-strand break repair nuclease NurA [archaeon]|nr:DNA double-strand break repair nuclease NurA [archaeon]
MELLLPQIKKLAESLRESEDKRRDLAEFLRSKNSDTKLFKRIEPEKSLDKVKIVGIDGGIVRKALHGFDFILARAAGVCFEYNQDKIVNASYFPSKFPSPRAFTLEAISDIDYAYFSSITRQKIEIETAIKCIAEFKPSILLLDGSIVPHHTTKPSSTSLAYKEYEELMSAYQQLYQEAEDSDVLLAGVIEDSRSERFCDLVKEIFAKKEPNPHFDILNKTRDSNLLFWALSEHERTATFPYTKEIEQHPILKDFEKRNFFSFYLKTAKFDRPVKVDFLNKDLDDKLASILLAISGQHSHYGFPSVLIEADNVAKLSEQEVENFYSYILKYTGNISSVMKLRREQRPF